MAFLRVYFKEYAKDIEEGVIKMSRILVLGAAGQVAQLVIEQLLKENRHELVLYLRHAERLSALAQNPHVTVIEGDVLGPRPVGRQFSWGRYRLRKFRRSVRTINAKRCRDNDCSGHQTINLYQWIRLVS